MKRALILFSLILATLCFAQTAPVITNVAVNQRTDGSMLVDVWYDLADLDGDPCEVYIKVSPNNGASWDIVPTIGFLSGDCGPGVMPGTAKHIVWDSGGEGYRLDGDSYRFKVEADDGSSPPVPSTFVFIPGGTFNNGTSNITISSFWLDKYEISQSQYLAIMGKNPAQGYGVGANHPVYYVSWYETVEYCNRRSILEGLDPCYSYSGYGTNPDTWPVGWNLADENHSLVYCDWGANGYRMPTEMEWMFAARGGNQSQNFVYAGSNDINQVGWYVDNSGFVTHMVGTKTPNELGLHDMTGNVWEWVWDIWQPDYIPGDQTDPHGPAGSQWHVTRGGAYQSQAQHCTTAFHNCGGKATHHMYSVGIRICRND